MKLSAALLRPLTQDAMLPTAAYLGGPAEIAYQAQILPAYAHFGIPRPALLPRPSVTLVEPAAARALEAEGLSLPDLEADPETVLARWARETYPDVESAFARAREALEREMARVEEMLGTLDPTLRAAVTSARGRALHQVEGLHEKATRALKRVGTSNAARSRARAGRKPAAARAKGLQNVTPGFTVNDATASIRWYSSSRSPSTRCARLRSSTSTRWSRRSGDRTSRSSWSRRRSSGWCTKATTSPTARGS